MKIKNLISHLIKFIILLYQKMIFFLYLNKDKCLEINIKILH